MRIFWTSDLHFGHSNIIRYCNRPFRNAEHMNSRLIAEINMRCKKGDTLINVGDFCCYGNERGIEGFRTKAEEYEGKINPKIIHIIGNHDKNNSVKGCIYGMVCKVSHWNVWVTHHPPWSEMTVTAPEGCNAYVCGHVHEKWQRETFNGHTVINVGVDANNYRPIRQDELVNMLKGRTE